ncbi:MAG: type I methionyl aminopeptidase [bacterium]
MNKPILIKTKKQIEKIREAGQVLFKLYNRLESYIEPGVSTLQVNNYAEKFIKKHGGYPTFKTVPGYKHALCISINNEIVHGIPRKDRIVKKGDIVSVDGGVTLNGYIGDSTRTFLMPGASEKAKKLNEVTKKSLMLGIEKAVPGNKMGDIGHAIQSYAEAEGFSVVRKYVGHGTGIQLHESPAVPHYGSPGEGMELKEGMVLAIEPMINEGNYNTKTLEDGWTVVTTDGLLSCQYEHTVALTSKGPEILTGE